MAAKYTPAQYLFLQGAHCPACGSTEITGDSVDVSNGMATQDVTCDECDAAWTDVYQLMKYRSLTDKFGNPV